MPAALLHAQWKDDLLFYGLGVFTLLVVSFLRKNRD